MKKAASILALLVLLGLMDSEASAGKFTINQNSPLLRRSTCTDGICTWCTKSKHCYLYSPNDCKGGKCTVWSAPKNRSPKFGPGKVTTVRGRVKGKSNPPSNNAPKHRITTPNAVSRKHR